MADIIEEKEIIEEVLPEVLADEVVAVPEAAPVGEREQAPARRLASIPPRRENGL